MSASHSARRGSTGIMLVLALVGLAAAGAGGYYIWSQFSSQDLKEPPLTHVVARGPFDHIVLEQGEVESSSNVEIPCEVKSRNSGTAILWVVDEGTVVKAGDRLVELDSSVLEQELTQQKIAVAVAEARVITAQSTLDQAKVAKEEYLDGTFAQEEKTIESEILVSEEALSRAEETAVYSEDLAALGFITPQQLRADQFAVKQRQVELKLAQQKLRTLREITKKKMLIGFVADIDAAVAQLNAEQESNNEEKSKLQEVIEQTGKCVVVAPQAGQVVHANQTSSRGNSEFVVEPGAMVRERQVIIRLPDPEQMRVKAKINESRVPLVEAGMPVAISIGAIEGTLNGQVTKVNKYAEPTSWFSSQVKEYATFVEILDPPETLRSGMTAEVRIFVQQLEDALQIPVQAALEEKQHYFCLVVHGDNPANWETREVQLGASNDKFLVVESGLEPGDVVALNPRQYREWMEIPELPDPPKPDMSRSSFQPGAKRSAENTGGGPAAGGPPGGGRPEGAGGPGAGGGGPGGSGGGPPSPAAIVSSVFGQYDTDNDGKVTSEELSSMEAARRDRMMQADANGDGSIDRAELTTAMTRMMSGGGGGPGGGGRPGGAGGGSRP